MSRLGAPVRAFSGRLCAGIVLFDVYVRLDALDGARVGSQFERF